jgi:hypothetical protein
MILYSAHFRYDTQDAPAGTARNHLDEASGWQRILMRHQVNETLEIPVLSGWRIIRPLVT